jgi:steroid 5-alpha reductase family enzyme
MNHLEVFAACAAAIAVVMLATWLLSLARRDASIVDVVWGLGFVVVAWVAYAVGDGLAERRLLLALMTTVWGLRLAAYLLRRNWGQGEDPRYVAMRSHHGDRFGLVSLGLVFGLQGAIMWVVSLPVQVGAVPELPDELGAVEAVGLVVWAVGLFFEAVGDWQLARFRADPAHRDRVLDRGLWRYTRHPNYFGDCCVWWGIWIVAATTGVGLYAIVGPLLMTYLLLRVSGVAMLERTIGRRRPGYDDYVARTNAFFPGPPRVTRPGSS